MIPVDGDVLRAVAPRFSGANGQAQARIITSIEGVLASTLDQFEINTRLRIAHFLAQITHESAGLRTTQEFASGRAYEGRKDLGNTQKGDGPRYKGRGLLQLTGRANYRRVGGIINLDLEGNPELAADPKVSLQIACEYWKDRKINPNCDADDLIAVTKKVNGGLNGLEDRRQFLVKAKTALARLEGAVVAGGTPSPAAPSGAAPSGGAPAAGAAPAPGGAKPTLRRGSQGDAVTELQQTLRKLGFALSIDADFGAATEVAVMKTQSDNGLTADGIVGPATWAKLDALAAKKT